MKPRGAGASRSEASEASPSERAGRIWMLTLGLTAVALALFFGWVRDLPPPTHMQLPWWILAVLFFLAEVYVAHLHFKGDAHSFTLSEIPLVLGLCLVSPVYLVLARLTGALAALTLHDRQRPIKLAFNIAYFGLETCVLILIFRALAPGQETTSLVGWLATFSATTVTTVLGCLMIFAVISLSQNEPAFEMLPLEIGFGTLVTFGNTCLALLALTILRFEPLATWLLVVPAVIFFFGYRAYTSGLQKRDTLEFLYETTRILHRSPEVESAMLGLLKQAQVMFKAERAEVVLFPSKDSGPALRTALGPGHATAVMEPLDDAVCRELRSHTPPDGRATLLTHANTEFLGRYWATEPKNAIIAPLQGETRKLGAILIGNRLGDIRTFDPDDVALFEALASHASITLENGRLEQSLAHLSELQAELEYQATHDALTGLANRSLFSARVTHALARNERRGGTIAVLLLDLDNFKTINDSFGHAWGDKLLAAVGRRLEDSMRPADTVARQGGDEFAILLEDIQGMAEATSIAERTVNALEASFVIEGNEFLVRTSLGIALSPGEGSSTEELLRNADMAMYAAKKSLRGHYEIFAPGLNEEALKRAQMQGDFQRAVQEGELMLAFQPIVDLETNRVAGVESLVRWDSPERGLLLPESFISVIEETGLILSLSRWVLKTACRQAAQWQRSYPGAVPLGVSVNLSAPELQKADLVDEVAAVIKETGVAPDSLTFEITETVLMREVGPTVRKLHELKSLGVQLAIDDFGTGYSSLSYLENFPVSSLKIAKQFLEGLGRGRNAALVHAIIRIAEALELSAVAEGIETTEQLKEMRRMRCNYGQGYLFAKPLPGDELEGMLGGHLPGVIDLRTRRAARGQLAPGRAAP